MTFSKLSALLRSLQYRSGITAQSDFSTAHEIEDAVTALSFYPERADITQIAGKLSDRSTPGIGNTKYEVIIKGRMNNPVLVWADNYAWGDPVWFWNDDGRTVAQFDSSIVLMVNFDVPVERGWTPQP